MRNLVSIVVPIYNVEKYIERCIKSIIDQTYKNIEILLIDDGSKDKSGKICDEYKKKDNRIIVIHKDNGGLSDARNCGIENATGEYICFIDSDDYIDKRFVEELYNMCDKNDAKISQCEFKVVTDNAKDNNEILNKTYNKITNKEMLKNIYNKGEYNTIICNKMFKRELFNNIRFPKGKINEDEFTTYKLFYIVENIVVTNQKLYNYYYREGSITKSKFNIRKLDYIEALEERLKIFKDNKEKELYEMTLHQYCHTLILFYYLAIRDIKDSKNIKIELLKKFRNNIKELLKISKIPIYKKCFYIFGTIFPKIVGKIIFSKTQKKSWGNNGK